MRMIGWFSGGVTSAVACKIAIDAGHDVDLFYCETGNHHSDHERFIQDCEHWYGRSIKILRSAKFASVEETIRYSKYLNGPDGAKCTRYLKKDLRIALEKVWPFDHQIFGFEYEKPQINRAIRFNEQYPDAKAVFPLIEKKIDKPMAMQMLVNAGIELPMMYRLGYSNSNCIGCVKGGAGYWNKIRRDFPEVFERMAKLEREINGAIIRQKGKRVFLDELDPSAGRHEDISLPECGVVCPVEMDGLSVIDDASRVTTGLFESEASK